MVRQAKTQIKNISFPPAAATFLWDKEKWGRQIPRRIAAENLLRQNGGFSWRKAPHAPTMEWRIFKKESQAECCFFSAKMLYY